MPSVDDHDSREAPGTSRPPFVIGSWAALAYVTGKYNPPGARKADAPATDFLGVYVSKADPGFGLITFNSATQYMAFHRCGEEDAMVEYAMIDAYLHYAIPFAQWQIYVPGERELAVLDEMGLREIHQRAMKALSAVLYQARFVIQPGRRQLEPMFLLSCRSNEEVAKDEATQNAMLKSLLGEQRANRYLAALAKMRARRLGSLENQGDPPSSDREPAE